MKKLISVFLLVILILLPAFCFAKGKAKQMNDGVPVWDETTVRQYALDYIEGSSMERLWGYYDLQIRRYMPQAFYKEMLTGLEWMTGKFETLGTYRCFEETDSGLKVHVLHLCMEKQDLDMYFSTKNQEDDWEIMAVEFIPAERQERPDGSDMLVHTDEEPAEKAE